MKTETQDREIAKKILRETLTTYGGDTKHQTVVAAIEKLTSLNPTAAAAHNETPIDGQWLLISAPNFPQGELRTDGKYAYTLGRLAFNMFQPTNLKVVIDRVLNPVFPVDDPGQRTHNFIVYFTTVDENIPTLQGIVQNLGLCQPSHDNILQVQFTGGILKPQEQQDMAVWQKVFANQSQATSRGLKEILMNGFLKMMFGIVPPQGMDRQTGEVSFRMQRSPKGSLELLYIDQELRITRGERGTVSVCERQIS